MRSRIGSIQIVTVVLQVTVIALFFALIPAHAQEKTKTESGYDLAFDYRSLSRLKPLELRYELWKRMITYKFACQKLHSLKRNSYLVARPVQLLWKELEESQAKIPYDQSKSLMENLGNDWNRIASSLEGGIEKAYQELDELNSERIRADLKALEARVGKNLEQMTSTEALWMSLRYPPEALGSLKEKLLKDFSEYAKRPQDCRESEVRFRTAALLKKQTLDQDEVGETRQVTLAAKGDRPEGRFSSLDAPAEASAETPSFNSAR